MTSRWQRAIATAAASVVDRVTPSSTLDAVARASPWLRPPTWLSPYCAALDDVTGRRLVVAAPPQHGKTEATCHALALRLTLPRSASAYVTYSAERAGDVAKRVADIARSLGLSVEANRRSVTCSETGSSVLFVGAMGALTGYPIRGLLVVDDPIKNALEACSPTYKRRLLEWFRSVAMTRVHDGSTVVVMMTRWDVEDLSGSLIGEGWESIVLPALDDDGNALAPELFTAEQLRTRRAEVGEYYWHAMYQGTPRARGGGLFRGVHYYSHLPRVCRYSLGADLAYSASSSADWSVLVELATERDLHYVTRVDRARVPAPDFAVVMKTAARRRPGVRIRWHASGTELGSVQLLQSLGVPIDARPAKGDKWLRAQPVAAAWNAGRVLLPDPDVFGEAQGWLEPFLDTIHGFTGSGREHDDDVDALGSAHSVFGSSVVTGYAEMVAARGNI